MAPRTDADLLALQGNIKKDPQSYEEEFQLQLRHYRACLDVFALKPSEESQEFTDLVTFVAQVASSYPQHMQGFVQDLSGLLDTHYAVLNSSVRHALVKALILLRNRKQVSAMDLLPLFFRLFRCQDKSLRQLLFRHIIADIKGANEKHHNQQLNRAIQNFLYSALEDPHEAAAKKSLAVLIELWRRQVWRDARTVNVIASAAVHSSIRIMLAALKFFLGQDEAEAADSDDEDEPDAPRLVNPSKAEVYKATKKGTVSSKRKKAAKLKRVMAAVKKQQRKTKRSHENFAAIQLLHDPQDFAEKLFKRLHKSAGERFEVRLAMMSVISRVMGVHRLLLLNFYPFMQKYVLPHQRDAPVLLAVLVQAVHEEVPPDALAAVLRQLVDHFVHDRARPEVMTLGLKTVRELCERAPLIMTPELLQDLALYKKFREKEVASAARSLIGLFREVAPRMLEKRDRGRDADLGAAPRAFGARAPSARVQGAELLQAVLERGEPGSDLEETWEEQGSDSEGSLEDADAQADMEGSGDDKIEGLEEGSGGAEPGCGRSETDSQDTADGSEAADGLEDELDSVRDEAEEASGDEGDASVSGSEAEVEEEALEVEGQQLPAEVAAAAGRQAEAPQRQGNSPKRKQEAVAGSLSSLKRELAEARAAKRAKTEATQQAAEAQPQAGEEAASVPLEYQRLLTEADFSRIRELRHEKLVGELMRKHGLKSSAKRERLLAAAQDEAEDALEKLDVQASVAEQKVDPGALTGRHKSRKSKEDKLASVREGREGREFGAAASRKHKKVGGSSNKEKLKRKNLPMGAKKAVVQRRAGKQRLGSKNFKGHVKRLR